MKPWQTLAVLVTVHVMLAIGYAAFTPYRTAGTLFMQANAHAEDIGAPDERQHANYIQHLLDGKGLPVLKPGDPNLYESYQSHQPPLFYWIAAGWAKVVGVVDVSQQGAGLPLRMLNVLIGAIGIVGIYFAAKWGFDDERLALYATAVAALLPMGCALSGAVSNDPLLIALCTWITALSLRSLQHKPGIREAAILGLLAGLAVLTKTTGLAAVPVILVALAWDAEKSKWSVGKPAWMAAGVSALVFLVLALPWFLRNQSVYGDPLAMGAFNEAFTGTMQAATGIERLGLAGYWWQVAQGTGSSFLGVFGYWDVWSPLWVYQAWAAVFLAALALAFVKWAKSRDPQTVVLSTLGLVILILFVRFNLQYFQAQGRYLYPAIVAFAVLVSVGTVTCFKKAPMASLILPVALLATNLWMLTSLPAEFKARVGTNQDGNPPAVGTYTPAGPSDVQLSYRAIGGGV